MPDTSIASYENVVNIYDLMSGGRMVEANFYASFLSQGRDLLELGSGTGILSEQLALRGFHVTGLDNSADMIARFRKRLPDHSVVEADMRDFEIDQKFDIVTVPYNSIAHLRSPQDVLNMCCAVRKHLRPQGRLVFDLRHFVAKHHQRLFVTCPVPYYLEEKSGLVAQIIRRGSVNEAATELELTWMICDQSLERVLQMERVTTYLHSQKRLHKLLKAAGFTIERDYADYFARPFHEESERLIIVAKAS